MSGDVLVVGGGIAGLSLALTLHQIGVPSRILEAASEVRPLGVGINLQPNAVRELIELGISLAELEAIGVPIREWALVGLNGRDVYSEPRGLEAGYLWPQIAVHRGELQMLLYRKVLERLGKDAITTGVRIRSYQKTDHGARALSTEGSFDGRLLIGADGIHSAVRSTMHPCQPSIHWGGAILFRGTVRARPLRMGGSFVGLGTHRQRMVIYPLSAPGADGTALINWIAEVTVDATEGWQQDGWFREIDVSSFAHHFDSYRFDWLDVPAMLEAADCSYENPMIDRDPVSTWVDGPVALIGDAAHAMYPTGSNGASQAIVDARILGAKMVEHGVTEAALSAYDEQLCAPLSQLVLRNRGAGPFGLLNLLDARCGGVFEDIEAVIPLAERQAFMAEYKAAAGFAMNELNAAPPIIETGAVVPA